MIAGQVLGGVRTAVLGIFSDSWSSTGGGVGQQCWGSLVIAGQVLVG